MFPHLPLSDPFPAVLRHSAARRMVSYTPAVRGHSRPFLTVDAVDAVRPVLPLSPVDVARSTPSRPSAVPTPSLTS